MARWTEPTKKQEREWRKWVAARPKKVRENAERLPPWELYRLKSTGQRVTVVGYFEDGTLRVNVPAEFNLTLFETSVFGIDPDDLEPCDLPSADEPVGAMMSGEQVDENIDALRVAIRPDLFTMGPDGKAMRKS